MSKYRCGLSRATRARDPQLRVERRARHALQPRHELAARGERREERQIQRVRQAENVRHESIVIIDAHLSLLGHRRSEQRARRARGLRNTDVAEHDVPPRQQPRVGPEHRMDRRDLATGRHEALEPAAQRALQRADVDDDAARPARRELGQHVARHLHRRRDDDEIVIERALRASRRRAETERRPGSDPRSRSRSPASSRNARTTHPSCRRRR